MISIISLCVAALAVIVGPLISVYINKKQIETSISIVDKQIKTSTRTAEKQIISPIRQAWIDDLRKIIAELTAKSAHYWVAGYEDRKDKEYYRITELEHELRLFLNSDENDNIRLLQEVKAMTNEISGGDVSGEKFWHAHEEVITISQQILKREWERVKKDV